MNSKDEKKLNFPVGRTAAKSAGSQRSKASKRGIRTTDKRRCYYFYASGIAAKRNNSRSRAP